MGRRRCRCGLACLACLALSIWVAAADPIDSAKWVAPTERVPFSQTGSILRLALQLPAPVASIAVSIAGLGHSELRINGAKVGQHELDSAWSNYNKTCYYVKHSLNFAAPVTNVTIGILLGNGMYLLPTIPNRYTKWQQSPADRFGPRAVRFAATFAFAGDREPLTIRTGDEGVTLYNDPAGGPMTTSHVYGGEDWDARLEVPGWDSSSVKEVAGWVPAQTWAGPSCTLQLQKLEPMMVQELVPEVRRTPHSEGLIFDLGKNFAGWPALTAAGPRGAQVQLVCGELLHADGSVNQQWSPQWYTYTLHGSTKTETWRPRFSFWGFRYCLAKTSGNATVVSLTGEMVFANASVVGSFESSEDIFMRTHNMVMQSIKANFGPVWMDCPHREKLGWLETSHLMMPSLAYNFDARALMHKILADIQESQLPSGLVPDISPEVTVFSDGFRDSPEWGSAIVFLADYLYSLYGDGEAIRKFYTGMAAYVGYLETKANPPFILNYGLGDWCDGKAKESHDCGMGGQYTKAGVTGTAMLYSTATKLRGFAQLLGLTSDEARWAALANSTAAAFHAAFFNASAGSYGSQTADGMALAMGIAPPKARGSVLEALVKDVRSKSFSVDSGEVGHPYVLRALIESRQFDLLHAVHTSTVYPSYGYLLGLGKTSLPEQWDGSNSQLHSMLGHVEEYFYKVLLGIQCSTEGCTVTPAPQGRWAKGSFRSLACGLVEVSWTLDAALTLRMTVAVDRGQRRASCPAGVQVRLPGAATFEAAPLGAVSTFEGVCAHCLRASDLITV